ncbi:MAG: calcium/sodium antiporter [Phycisphaerales bacterium]|nr:calcium/sodium antiporter [Phycisphaerales bacterium]
MPQSVINLWGSVPPVVQGVLLLALGIVLLVKGGDLLVSGAVTLAHKMGIPTLVIGLTVVAFGTSAPELALNLAAALNDNSGLAFGNVVGSNIANIGLILGVAAIISPIRVNSIVIRRELPIMIAVTLITVTLMWLPHSVGGVGAADDVTLHVLSRNDGAFLLGIFLAFIGYQVWAAKSPKSVGGIEPQLEQFSEKDRKRSAGVGVVLVLIGLVGLAAGGKLSEMGAVSVARVMGMSNELIGLTIVALATSLPELFTSVAAARKGQADIAVGNVVGSNVFNLLLVLGASAMANPVLVPMHGERALVVLVGISILLWPVCRMGGKMVSRIEGALLLAIYMAVMAWEVWIAMGARGGG